MLPSASRLDVVPMFGISSHPFATLFGKGACTIRLHPEAWLFWSNPIHDAF
jgi:hypothetical protein